MYSSVNAEALATCIFREVQSAVEILYFTVAATWRNNGVGSRLVKHICQHAKNIKATRLVIHISYDAKQFWTKALNKAEMVGQVDDLPIDDGSRRQLAKMENAVQIYAEIQTVLETGGCLHASADKTWEQMCLNIKDWVGKSRVADYALRIEGGTQLMLGTLVPEELHGGVKCTLHTPAFVPKEICDSLNTLVDLVKEEVPVLKDMVTAEMQLLAANTTRSQTPHFDNFPTHGGAQWLITVPFDGPTNPTLFREQQALPGCDALLQVTDMLRLVAKRSNTPVDVTAEGFFDRLCDEKAPICKADWEVVQLILRQQRLMKNDGEKYVLLEAVEQAWEKAKGNLDRLGTLLGEIVFTEGEKKKIGVGECCVVATSCLHAGAGKADGEEVRRVLYIRLVTSEFLKGTKWNDDLKKAVALYSGRRTTFQSKFQGNVAHDTLHELWRTKVLTALDRVEECDRNNNTYSTAALPIVLEAWQKGVTQGLKSTFS